MDYYCFEGVISSSSLHNKKETWTTITPAGLQTPCGAELGTWEAGSAGGRCGRPRGRQKPHARPQAQHVGIDHHHQTTLKLLRARAPRYENGPEPIAMQSCTDARTTSASESDGRAFPLRPCPSSRKEKLWSSHGRTVDLPRDPICMVQLSTAPSTVGPCDKVLRVRFSVSTLGGV